MCRNKWWSGVPDDMPPDEILLTVARLMRATSDLLKVPDGDEEVTLQDYTVDLFRNLLEYMAEDLLTVRMAIKRGIARACGLGDIPQAPETTGARFGEPA